VTNAHLIDCVHPGQGLDRVHYFPRQLLTADDMVAEQRYFREKLRRHNRFLHGWGVVCGLEVRPAPTDDAPWRVQITSGMALGPYGDDIYVSESVFLDLARCGPGTTTDPCTPNQLRRPDTATTGGPVFVAITYAECVARPVQVMPAGCACDEAACEYSRIRDSFRVECLPELPASHQPGEASPSLCDFINTPQLVPCLPCPPDTWVVLAQVELPASPATHLAAAQINNFVRRQLYSTAVLQEMVIACCCEETPPTTPPPTITGVSPIRVEVGAELTIEGTNFGSPPAAIGVTLDGIAVSVPSNRHLTRSLTFVVPSIEPLPDNGRIVEVTVTTSSGTASTTDLPEPNQPRVLPSSGSLPVITAITGPAGEPIRLDGTGIVTVGERVTITGQNFAPTAAQNQLAIITQSGEITRPVESASESQIEFTVPELPAHANTNRFIQAPFAVQVGDDQSNRSLTVDLTFRLPA
jgi:hypothetical protein